MIKHCHYLLILSLFICNNANTEVLPGQHKLIKNELNEYYVINNKDITMIEASILKFGFSGRWILACLKNKSVDTDLKRWVFIDLKNGGTFDSLNEENWRYFRDEAYPDLKKIKLRDLNNEDCP